MWCGMVDELIGRSTNLPPKRLYSLIRKFGNASASAFDNDDDNSDNGGNEENENVNNNGHNNTNSEIVMMAMVKSMLIICY